MRLQATSFALALALALATTAMIGGCSAEEDVVNECDTQSGEPNDGCVPGYTCVARPEGEICVPESQSLGLHVGTAPASAAAPAARPERAHEPAVWRAGDPSLRLLRRLGYVSDSF